MAGLASLHERNRLGGLAATVVFGVLAGALVPFPDGTTTLARVLFGFAVTAIGNSLWTLNLLWRADADDTAKLLHGLDAGPQASDVIVIIATLASLAGVALLLIAGQRRPDNLQVLEALLAVLTVVSGWVLMHTQYSIRYAREWFAQKGAIDFNTDDPPRMSDFVYLSFGVGMTFGITDNSLTTSRLRRVVLVHCALAYLIGTVVIGSMINLLTSGA